LEQSTFKISHNPLYHWLKIFVIVHSIHYASIYNILPPLHSQEQLLPNVLLLDPNQVTLPNEMQ
jgi:hypothetical protein